MKFNLSDEATLADWKGWDLSQTKSIPDIDILLLAVRKVNILHLNSSGSYIQSSPSNLKQFIISRELYTLRRKSIGPFAVYSYKSEISILLEMNLKIGKFIFS